MHNIKRFNLTSLDLTRTGIDPRCESPKLMMGELFEEYSLEQSEEIEV